METGNLTKQERGPVVWMPTAGGLIQVWERPRVGCRYLLSVRGGGTPKVVGGKRDRARSVVMVLRKWFQEENSEDFFPTRLVARLRPPLVLDPTPLAEIVAAVAEWYGNALSFVEIADGAVTAQECQRLNVAVQMRQVVDKANQTWGKELGWETDDETGPAAENALKNAIRETGVNPRGKGALQLECPHALEEILTHKPTDGVTPAVSHDDDYQALAVGLYNIESATKIHPETRTRQAPRDGWKVCERF